VIPFLPLSVVHPGAFAGSLYQAIQDLSLTGNLKLCIDAGDSGCYGGSGQTITDLSAEGSDLWLGATSSGEASDPTFNGSAGGLSASEYFSFDGGDWLTFKSKPTWIDALHKTNGVWTVVAGIYIPNLTGDSGIFGNNDTSWNRIGTSVAVTSGEKLRIDVTDGGGSPPAIQQASTAALDISAWNIVGVSVDEATGGTASFFNINGTEETFDGSYTSPSSAAASHTPEVMATGGGSGTNDPMESGGRLGFLGVWDTDLSQANVEALRALMRSRYSI
jgi:hypothetical protein